MVPYWLSSVGVLTCEKCQPLPPSFQRFSHLTAPTKHDRWKNRSKTLAAELAALDSDVLAMQEVDQYEDFWAPWWGCTI